MLLFFCDDVLVFCNSAIIIACTYFSNFSTIKFLFISNEVFSAPSSARVTLVPPFGQEGNWNELRSSFLLEEKSKKEITREMAAD